MIFFKCHRFIIVWTFLYNIYSPSGSFSHWAFIVQIQHLICTYSGLQMTRICVWPSSTCLSGLTYFIFKLYHSCLHYNSSFQLVLDFTGSRTTLSNSATHTISTLSLPFVHLADSGNYSCQPASLQRVAITLHVLQEEKEQKLVVKEVLSSASDSVIGLIDPIGVFIMIVIRIFLLTMLQWQKMEIKVSIFKATETSCYQ